MLRRLRHAWGVRRRRDIREPDSSDVPRLSGRFSHRYPACTASRLRRNDTSCRWMPIQFPQSNRVMTDGRLPAAIITTDSARNERAGEAFIAELITHADHRRQGLAEELLRRCMHVLHSMGRSAVAVSVDSSNSAAMALYLSRDFRRLTDDRHRRGHRLNKPRRPGAPRSSRPSGRSWGRRPGVLRISCPGPSAARVPTPSCRAPTEPRGIRRVRCWSLFGSGVSGACRTSGRSGLPRVS
jgi:N-alpha-acetyltransferase 10/11